MLVVIFSTDKLEFVKQFGCVVKSCEEIKWHLVESEAKLAVALTGNCKKNANCHHMEAFFMMK